MSTDTMWSILVVMWIVTAIVVTIFPLAYLFSRWWVTPEGRAIMFRSSALMLLVDETVILYFWPIENLMWKYGLQAATLAYTIAAAIYLAYVLIRGQVTGLRLRQPQQ